MASLRLTLFGGFQACDGVGRALELTGTRPTLLLAYLALQAGKTETREKLMALLWSDRGELQARASLRQAIWALRRAFQTIAPSPLVCEGDAIQLDPVLTDSDVLTFERLLADGSPEALESAMALYRGELLQGVRVPDSAFEDFLRGERQRFQELAVNCGTQLLDFQLQQGSSKAATATARRLLALDPLQELAHRALIQCYAEQGQIGLAHKQYQRCREILDRELGIEPEPETQRLFERIRLARPGGSSQGDHGPPAGRPADGAAHCRPGTTGGGALQEPLRLGLAVEETVPSVSGAASFLHPHEDHKEPEVRCPRCRCKNRMGSRFCIECGEALVAVCSACGAAIISGQNFCTECGAPVARPPPGFPESRPPSAQLSQKVAAVPPVLEGERKQVSVLFADIFGSVQLVAGSDPEEARRTLEPMLRIMIEAVHLYDGIVSRVLGDSIIAVFGAPLAHEDHAIRACYAALSMQHALRRAGQTASVAAAEPQIRVGINSGEVVVRTVHSDYAMEYDAIGPTVLLAGRMQQLAQPGTICLSEPTLRLAEGFVSVKPLGSAPIEGLARPVTTYQLEGATPTRSRFQATVARGLSGFVGRQRELEALGRALEEAEQGRGQVFAVLGEPGVGKSRLLYEFTYGRRTIDRLILETRCASYCKATPYHPVIELLRGYFQVDPRDIPAFVAEKIRAKLASLGSEYENAAAPLLSLLDVPMRDPAWEALDAAERRRRTMETINGILIAESRRQTLLLVIEDLQWADHETQACLDILVDCLPAARLLLLVSYRLEYSHRWTNRTYYRQRSLAPLPPDSARTLLDSLLGHDPLLQELKQMLLERADGNPLFIEESVRTLLEKGSLVGERGALRLMHDVVSIEIPETVRDILAARLDRLPAKDKQLLQTASVIGKDVRLALLAAVSDLPEPELLKRLAALRAAEFLYETSLFPEIEYTFKHALTHEVTYGSLLIERRQALHRRVVDAIERLYPTRLAEHIDRLAFHALQGEMWDRAPVFLQEAGGKAAARSAYRDAVSAFEKALVALSHLPESDQTLRQAIDLRFELRSSLQALCDHQRIFEHLREAEALSSKLGDKDRLGWASAYLSQYLRWEGAAAEAELLGNRALAIAASADDVALKVVATFFLGQGCYNLGQYRRAADYCRQNVSLLQGVWAYERLGLTGLPSVLSRIWLAWSLAEQGEFAEALQHVQDALAIAEAADQPYSIAAGCLGLGQVHLLQGKIGPAVAVLERAAEFCRIWNLRLIGRRTAAALGLAQAWRGHSAEALPLLEESATETAQVRIFDSPLATSAQAIGYLAAGRAEEAARIAVNNLDLATRRGFRGSEAWSLYVVGLALSRGDQPDRAAAEDHLRRGLALAEQFGMRPLTAHCRGALAKLGQGRGSRREAEQHSAAAYALYAQMQMDFWLRRLKAPQELR